MSRITRTRITFDFRTKNKKQLPLFMAIKEYYDADGNIEFAKVLFEIKGRKYKKLCKKMRWTDEQIEEMVADISERQNGGWKFVGDSEYTTDVYNEELAEHLYNAGYRKRGENVIVLPCKIGSTIYKIDKSCDINNGYKDEYKCFPEFDKNCEYFEDDYWEQPHFCKKIGSFEGDYCKFNLDIVCDNCKERLCVQKDIFDYGKIPQIFGTPFFDKNTNLCDTYFLTKEEAEKAIAELKKKYTGASDGKYNTRNL